MKIRQEKPQDIDGIRHVNIAAFGRQNEANLVDRLRGLENSLSLVAIESENIVGHIFYSPVTIDDTPSNRSLFLGLAPIAVLPKSQKKGIGKSLIQYSLAVCQELGFTGIFVLGSPIYYTKFGFTNTKEKGLRCEYDVPEEAFMCLELVPGSLNNCNGLVKYHQEFQLCT